MATKPVSENEVFKAGFKHGYTNGRVAELKPSDIEVNAEAAYQEWRKTQLAFGGAVIPVKGVQKVGEEYTLAYAPPDKSITCGPRTGHGL
jgi:hypothetical protein